MINTNCSSQQHSNSYIATVTRQQDKMVKQLFFFFQISSRNDHYTGFYSVKEEKNDQNFHVQIYIDIPYFPKYSNWANNVYPDQTAPYDSDYTVSLGSKFQQSSTDRTMHPILKGNG